MRDHPTVSIVIPCRNEEAYIAQCVNSFLAQDYPKDKLEIIVCDGKSTDRTLNILNELASANPSVRILTNERQTTPHALNLGITESKADIVIIFGAHAYAKQDYVSVCAEVLSANNETGCCGGYIENIDENDTAHIISMCMSSAFGVGNAHFRTGNRSGFVDTVAFGAYKREVFTKAGLFNPELVRNQDDEFNFRLLKNGYKIFLDTRIYSWYYVRGSYAKLSRQYYQYGYWKVYVNRLHGTITTLRQVIPLLFVLGLIGGVILSALIPVLWIPFLACLGLYALAAIFSALKKTKRPGEILQMLACFVILHGCYGWGYLVGVVDFLLLNRKPVKSSMEMSRG